MRLELGKVFIKNVEFGDKTIVSNGALKINKNELKEIIKEDIRIKDVEIDIALPGEKIRIIPVKDVIEPRVKIKGDGNGFPGVTHKISQVGWGLTNALKGVAVVTTGDIVGIQEGVIDMWGEGAKYTPFSKTNNVVINIKPIEGIKEHEHEEAVRIAGLKAATYLGEAARQIKPDEIDVFEIDSIAETIKKHHDLPRVVYIEILITQGLLHDTYIYGVDAKQTLPTFIHPNEILDGAVVSGNCVAACDKTTTYQHQNNTVILDLYEKHGKELNFLGVILTNEKVTLEGKIRSCNFAANMAKMLGAEGAIISEEGYGNPDTDLLQICKKLENEGIKTVLITDECAGRDGLSQSLADAVTEAKAIVSTGNVSHLVKLPPADKVIGSKEAIRNLSGGYDESICEDGSIICELNAIIGSTSEIGYHNLTAKMY
jgi:sarcosine reductase